MNAHLKSGRATGRTWRRAPRRWSRVGGRCALLAVAMAWRPGGAWGQEEVTITSSTNISAENFQYDNKRITISGAGATVSMAGEHAFLSVTLTNGARLTHPACTTSQTYSLDLTIDGTLAVSSNSSIDVSGQGYPWGRTNPNTTNGASTSQAGGSFAGVGGKYSGVPNAAYGDFRNPNEPGSGGGMYSIQNGNQAGGGLARITAGALALEGSIKADGVDGTYYGRGSGGGIYLNVGQLSGGGSIQAKGGRVSNQGGGGGGGRVAIYYQTLLGFDLSNRVSAAGGRGASADSDGGAGTIYVKGAGEEEWLLLDGGTSRSGSTPLYLLEGATNFSGRLTVRGSTTNVVVSNNLVNAQYNEIRVESGRLAFPFVQAVTASNVELGAGSILEYNGTLHAQTVTLATNAMLTHSACTSNETFSLTLVVDDVLTVSSNSTIDVSGRGYLQGRTHPNTTTGASTGRTGGSYGGVGGKYSGVPNVAYGDFRNPNEPGSGAGTEGSAGNQAGGGLARITAGALALEGSIKADGVDGNYGRGSGGGIYLNVGQLLGGGSIQAQGGTGSNQSGGGGGGRVAIYYESNTGFDLSNRVSAAGGRGYSADNDAGAGTIYVKGAGEEEWLLLDGGTSRSGTTPLYLPEGATNFAGRLTVRGSTTNNVVMNHLTNAVYSAIHVTTGALIHAYMKDYDLDELTLASNSLLEINGTVSVAELAVPAGAVLTHSACASNAIYSLALVVDGLLSVSSNGAIDVSGKGYPWGYTHPGTTNGASQSCAGGSYGGLGGRVYDGSPPNGAYGDFRNPNEPGSGGGVYSGQSGNEAGGGLVRIMAGVLALEGTIKANGADGQYGRGSGGGVYINAGQLSGGGQIQAQGGTGSYQSGGGGGGRVAIYYESNTGFNLSNGVSAAGGRGQGSSFVDAGAGTIYIKAASEEEWLLLDGGSSTCGTTPLYLPEGATNFAGRLTMLGSTTNLVVSNNLLNAQYSDIRVMSGRMSFPFSQTLTASNVALGIGSLLEFNGTLCARTVTLATNAMLTHSACTSNTIYSLALVVDGLLSVSSNGAIDVSGRGYPHGYTHPGTTNGASVGYAGGSYGGFGGGAGAQTPNAVYGDYRNPNEPGSGGGGGSVYGNQSGGGLARIMATELELDGTIKANGMDYSYAGRGSGGGIYLEVEQLSGGGSIQAKGGNTTGGSGGGGGGGRIAIYYQEQAGFDFTNRVDASGGTGSGGYSAGSTGTIYITSSFPPVWVSGFTPAGQVNAPVSSLLLSFASLIDDATFTLDDLSLAGPSGAVALSALVKLDMFRYRIDLTAPAQTDGAYAFTLGTNLLTQAGSPPEGIYTNGFIVDLTLPQAPVVTNWPGAPATNGVRTTSVTLQGTREDDTAIVVNGTQGTTYGTEFWSVSLTLSQGVNHLSYWATDRAGNASATNRVIFFVDSAAPWIWEWFPANGAATNASPPFVRLTYVEATSGLNWPACSNSMAKSGILIPGTWEMTSTNVITFTPAGALLDGTYTNRSQLVDRMGNTGSLNTATFTVDTVSPTAPVLNPVTSPTTISQQTITGTREAGATIYVYRGGSSIGSMSGGGTSLSLTVPLTNGWNYISFVAKDAAQNLSDPTNVEILYDNTAPGPVTITAAVAGVGTAIGLGWPGYNEMTNGGDIASYTIYKSASSFTHVSEAAAIGTRSAGQQSFVVTGLVRGVTQYYAVMARDTAGQAISNVTSLAAAPVDVTPPPNPGHLAFDCGWSNLTVRWSPSTDPDADLVGYQVYFNNQPAGTSVGLSTQCLFEGLLSATMHPVRVTALDANTNESGGATGGGVTLLANPTNVTALPYSGSADLTWSASMPTQYVKHYAVFYSTTNFSDTTGLSPATTFTTVTGSVAGLENNVEYFFGVATVNLAGGMDTNVTTTWVMPQADTNGPAISGVTFDATPVTGALVVERPGTFQVVAKDRAGVAKVEFRVNGGALTTVSSGATNFSAFWNAAQTPADGVYELEVAAYDTLNNSTLLATNFHVALATPAAPTISDPKSGIAINRTWLTVSGTGALHAASVRVYVNGQAMTGTAATVMANGSFFGEATLSSGTNAIRAAAVNRAGVGALSAAVSVTVDLSVPDAPRFVRATAGEGGKVDLSWSGPSALLGYRIYRAASEFETREQATLLNAGHLANAFYRDLPAADGTYYYRVSGTNAVGTESALSALVSATSDRTPPRVVSAEYSTTGPYDPIGGRYGRGGLTAILMLSEELMAPPFFSLNVPGETPLVFALRVSYTNPLVYSGTVAVSDGSPSGVAYALFSGRDAIGNRGTEVEAGAVVELDTRGPVLSLLQVSPSAPMENNPASPLAINVTALFDAEDTPVSGPVLRWKMSQSGAAWSNVALAPLTASSWAGTLQLSAQAGQSPEYLEFQYEGVDGLSNTGRTIAGESRFQVYQGALPPLDAPLGLTGSALSDGWVQLDWAGVEGAADYAIYMGAASNALAFVAPTGGATTWSDQIGDETNWYGVASVRQVGARSATSAVEAVVRVVTDAQPPETPENTRLQLYGNGMHVTWGAISDTNSRYALYRSTAPITGAGLPAPLTTNIPRAEALDGNPLKGPSYYAVTARDSAGNESPPSANAYTNQSLLPVNSLLVRLEEGGVPALRWTHSSPSGIEGFNIYIERDGEAMRVDTLNGSSVTQWVDTGYAGTARRYTVRARESGGGESVPRTVELPALTFRSETNTVINRGTMNRVPYQLINAMNGSVTGIQLKVGMLGRMHVTGGVEARPGESTASVVVGGYSNLPAVVTLTNTLEAASLEGRVELVGRSSHPTGTDVLVAELVHEELTRGAVGQVRFVLHNSSTEILEVILAAGHRALPSPEVSIRLLAADDMVLSSAAPRQYTGEGVWTLANGYTVAQIPAGKSFTSAPVDLVIPTNAPDSAVLQVQLDAIHYRLGQPEHVAVEGPLARRPVTLKETTYFAQITNVTPQASLGLTNITLQGVAIRRDLLQPQPEVPVKVVVSLRGYERTYSATSDIAGGFELEYIPVAGESGVYSVWASHPGVSAASPQGQFVIQDVEVTPKTVILSIPWSYVYSGQVNVTPRTGTELNQLRLVCLPEDQPGGALPAGVYVYGLGEAERVAGGESSALAYTVVGDETAASNVTAVLRVASDEGPAQGWEKVTLTLRLSEARPVLGVSPSYVETGLKPGEETQASLIVSNAGFAAAQSLTLTLTQTNGAAPPEWAILGSDAQVGDLPPGETALVTLRFAPPTGTAEFPWEFRLQCSATNQASAGVPVFVNVDNSGRGAALFKLMDIYTGSTNSQGGIIQGVSGARIALSRETGLAYETNAVTDELGEGFVPNLPEGPYRYRITSSEHLPLTGRLWIRSGLTTPEERMLENDLIRVEWTVREVELEDRYEIVLSTIFATDVPAPVLITDPDRFDLKHANLKPGEMARGVFSMVNQGWLPATNVHITQKTTIGDYYIEFSQKLPGTIFPKETNQVGYKIVRMYGNLGDGGGGGSCATVKYKILSWESQCINGVNVKSSRSIPVISYGACDEAGSGSTGSGEVESYIWLSKGGSTEGGGGVSRPSSVGDECSPPPPPPPPPGGCPPEDPCCGKRSLEKVNSEVRFYTGQYEDDCEDLWVLDAGRKIGIRRIYGLIQNSTTDGKDDWSFRENFNFLDLSRTNSHPGVSVRWEGRPPLYYTYGTNALLEGVSDQFSNQVLWIEYTEVAGRPRVSRAQDHSGRSVRYQYNTNGMLTNVVDVMGLEESYVYDEDSRLIQKRLPGEQPVDISYHADGTIARVGDTRFEYQFDETAKVVDTTIYKPDGRIWELRSDYNGFPLRRAINGVVIYQAVPSNLVAQVEARQEYPRHTYRDDNLLESVEFENGTQRTYAYNHPYGRPTEFVNERGVISRIWYDAADQPTSEVHAADTYYERQIDYAYDDDGQVVRRTLRGRNGQSDLTWWFTYDGQGNVKTETDPWGGVSSNAYDIMGNRIMHRSADGGTWRYLYDARSRLVSQTDPLGRVTSNRYDAAGRLLWTRDPLGRVVTRGYNEKGLQTAVTNEWGETATMEYDAWNHVTRLKDFDGKEEIATYNEHGELLRSARTETLDGVRYAYDDKNRLIHMTDGARTNSAAYDAQGLPAVLNRGGGVQELDYDRQGSLTRLTDRDGTRTRSGSWAYNLHGEVVEYTDPLGRKTRYGYDSLGRMTSVEDPLGRLYRVVFEPGGTISSYVDEKNQAVDVDFDYATLTSTETRPDGSVWIRQTDPSGDLMETRDNSGRVTQWGRDLMGRVTNQACFTTNGSSPAIEAFYAYDADDRLTQCGAGSHEITIEYTDGTNLLERATVDFGPFSKTFERTLNREGRIIRFKGPEGEVSDYEYNEAGDLAAIHIGDRTLRMATDPLTGHMDITYPGGARQQISKDAWGQTITNRLEDAGGTPIVERTYQYHLDGRLASVQAGEDIRAYQYDPVGALSAATWGGETNTYTHDAAGNRLTAGAGTNVWAYTNWNRLVSWSDGAYQYDAFGRVTHRTVDGQSQQLSYDAAGRLAEVRDGEGALMARYGYDALNRRVVKETPAETNFYLYGLQGLLAEYDGSGNLVREYGWLPDQEWMGAPLWMSQAGVRAYYVQDDVMAAECLIRENGAVVWSARAMENGRMVVAESSTLDNPLRMSGQYFDEETGLHYNTHRYYDPETGRYLTPDPSGYSDGLNLYLFGGDDPVNRFDVAGLSCKPQQMAIGWSKRWNCKTCEEEFYCRTFKTARDAIRLAIDDGTYKFAPEGFELIDAWDDKKSGFQAALWEGPDGKVYCAFRGTEFWNPERKILNRCVEAYKDFVPADIGQGLGGMPGQYQKTYSLAMHLYRKYGDRLTFVGHSLGGGLATMANQATRGRVPTYAFTPAGLHPRNAEKFMGKDALCNDNLYTFDSQGEILGWLQDKSILAPIMPGGGGLRIPMLVGRDPLDWPRHPKVVKWVRENNNPLARALLSPWRGGIAVKDLVERAKGHLGDNVMKVVDTTWTMYCADFE